MKREGRICVKLKGAPFHVEFPHSFCLYHCFSNLSVVVGWMVSPKRYVSRTYGCEGKGVFAGVIKNLKMRSFWITKWALHPMTSVFVRDRRREDKTHRWESHVKMGAETGGMQPQWRPTDTRNWKRQGTGEPWEGVRSCHANTLIQTSGLQSWICTSDKLPGVASAADLGTTF